MTDEEPKSAWEIALERFRKQDAEKGVVEQALTEEQKAAIEECRRSYQAKIAELERKYLNGERDARHFAIFKSYRLLLCQKTG